MERPLFWRQGLFLQPQHFQLEDLHVASLLTPFHQHLLPDFWGVGRLDIQTSALKNRTFSLKEGEFLFPDMSYVVLQGNAPGNALVEARSFDDAWVEGGKPFTVYLGLRKLNRAGENVTVLPKLQDLSRVATRFVTEADPEEVYDLYQQGPPGQVQRLFYVLGLFWETEMSRLGEYSLIPIAQLERHGEEIALSEKFAPPCFTLFGSESLSKIAIDIRNQITARGHQLESYKKQRHIHTAEFGTRDMVYLLALRSLNRYIPLLYHLTASRQVHPWKFYALLRQLIGELSTFSIGIDVMGALADGSRSLPDYDHETLWHCFSSAQSLISRLLDEITAGPEYVIALLFDETFYAAHLPPQVFEERNRFYLVVETEVDPKTVLQDLEKISKLGSRERLPLLVARALPGIKLNHLPNPPQELPRRSQCLYFQIDHHSENWAEVKKTYNLALYWDRAPKDLKVELMVVGRT